MGKTSTATTTSTITYTNHQVYKTTTGKFAILLIGSAGTVEIACDSKEELLNLLSSLTLAAASL